MSLLGILTIICNIAVIVYIIKNKDNSIVNQIILVIYYCVVDGAVDVLSVLSSCESNFGTVV